MATKTKPDRLPAGAYHKINMRVENTPQNNQQQQTQQQNTFLNPEVDNYIQRIRINDLKRKAETVQDLEIDAALERQKAVLEEAKIQYKNLLSHNNPKAVGPIAKEMQQFSVDQIIQLSTLPEEQQQKVISLNMALKGGQSGQGGMNEYLLPMIMYSQKNQGAGLTDLLSAVEKIMAIKEGNITKETSNPMDIVREAMDLAKEYSGLGKREQQEPQNPFGLLGDPNFAQSLATLREVFGGNNTVNAAQSLRSETLELTKAKNDFDLAMKRLDQEKYLEEKKLGVDEKRADAATQGIERVAATVATALASRGQSSNDDEVDDRLSRPSQKDSVERLICPQCGNEIVAPNLKPGQTIKCGKCGSESKAE